MYEYLAWSSLSLPHLLFLLVVDTRSIHGENCIQDIRYMISGKLASLSMWNFRVLVMLICSVIYTFSCVPVTKVYHVILCFSIRWKSSGSLFIKCPNFNLSWSLIVTPLGKLTLFSLKVTLTSFQSISNVSKCHFYTALCFQLLACL